MNADALGGGALLSASPTNEDIEPEFHAVTTGKRRRGLRLEKIYWRELDAIGQRRGLSRSRLITNVLAGASDDQNAASVLRCYVVATVETERQELLEVAAVPHLLRLMQQAPVPAFAINRQRKLQQANAEFMQFLRAGAGEGVSRIAADTVHLALTTPIEQLFLQLKAAPFSAVCGYALRVEDRHRRGQAKVVAVPGADDVLVGYVLS